MSNFENLRLEIVDEIATITFDRPRALNALNAATLGELDAAITAIEERGGVRGLILTGAGKAFVAGADIASMKEMSPEEAEFFGRKGSGIFRRIESLPIPVVAAVNGFALGGGCELALSADFIIASDLAKFGQPEVQLGLIAGFGGTQRLLRKVPYGAAMELLLNGATIDAQHAARIGLANRVVAPDALLAEAQSALRLIISKAPLAVLATKRLVQKAADVPLAEGLEAESAEFGNIFKTRDCREGVTAFLEKRPPVFRAE